MKSRKYGYIRSSLTLVYVWLLVGLVTPVLAFFPTQPLSSRSFLPSNEVYNTPLVQKTISIPSTTPKAVKKVYRSVEVSYYTASADETDNTPFITANGTDIRNTKDNVIALNWLPFGSKVEIEGVVYTVHDRMNRRYKEGYADILVKTKKEAFEKGRDKVDLILLSK